MISTPDRRPARAHAAPDGAQPGPWPAVLEQLPEYEPVSLASGILPGDEAGPNTLFWARSNGATRLGIWVGPRLWRLTLRSPEPGGKDRRLRLPFPGLLFIARPDASGAYVFAAPRRPRTLDDPLHHCPAPNVFANGKICPGDHAFARDP